ncbi:unnamed protein product [Camellia sinensis]
MLWTLNLSAFIHLFEPLEREREGKKIWVCLLTQKEGQGRGWTKVESDGSKIGSPMALRDVLRRSAKLTTQAAVERGIIESAHDSAEETVGAAVKLGEELVGRRWDGHVYGQIRMVVFDDLLRAAGFDESVEDPNHVNKVISRL